MEQDEIDSRIDAIADQLRELRDQAQEMASQAAESAQAALASAPAHSGAQDFLTVGLTVFVLACFVGYYVVWRVTPALHSPLMSVTNAVSSVIIVGALIAAGPADFTFSSAMGFLAVVLASVNIFGGFIVTQRMLQMYKKKKR